MSGSDELTTPRLKLRRFRHADADFVIALVNDPAWLRFIGDRNVHSRDAAEAYIARMNRMHEEYGHGALLIELRATGAPLGMAGLFRRPGLAVADIGFALLPQYYGCGYAHEAAEAVLQDARERLKLRQVLGVTVPENTASICLLEKLGLRFDRTVRLPGGTEDVSIYRLKWRQKKPAGDARGGRQSITDPTISLARAD